MEADEKACPKCGETIKAVAIRCKHCHADLAAGADFDRGVGAESAKLSAAEFEQKFLELAYQTTGVINAASTAHALKLPIAETEERLEDLAARDVLIRDVDDEGIVFYRLPGKGALVKTGSAALAPKVAPGAIGPPISAQATNAFVLNLIVPGVGSLVAGKTVEGIFQLVLLMIGLPLCLILVGLPIVAVSWGWALATSLRAMSESQRR